MAQGYSGKSCDIIGYSGYSAYSGYSMYGYSSTPSRHWLATHGRSTDIHSFSVKKHKRSIIQKIKDFICKL